MNQNNIRLRPLQETDICGMLEWMHDKDINKFFRFDARNMMQEDALKFIQDSIQDMREKRSYHFAVTDERNEYLGTISLKAINFKDRNAEYAVSLRKTAQGRGVGYAATRQLLNKAFNELELERVYLNVLSENKRAIRLYEKCGFTLEGEFRNHLWLGEGYQNLRWYAMLRKEYQGLQYCVGGGIK